ncbi:DUF2511 domain-containing protein [Psychrobacter sp. UBA5136]|uniref:DUF2511 domain-containing protein n=1 Tax=Psychrobacter sp. UBA5136 TaxID=1947356 RepID=UPI0025EDD567|nr:DUF2511 domain-containing protein [Psychrobacter sp. UBA5136]
MIKIENTKYFALLRELNTSEKLIELGFGELQNMSFTEDEKFYFLPFQLLSQGFERMMKAYICLGHYQKYGKFPEGTYLRNKLGHDLEKLLDEIVNNYYFDYTRPQFELDNKFLQTNLDLKELLSILSDFGRFARYYNFDLITGSSKENTDTEESWKAFEAKILDSEDYEKLADLNFNHEVYQKISTYIVTIFERFVSALSRQFIFNCLGQEAKALSVANFFDFGKLYEQDFGRKDYRYQTTKYKETPKNLHKRTILDEIQRKVNSTYKSRKVLKSEYDKDWPFYEDEVIIECRESHWCVVTINGFDYALNGSAKSRYKLESPHDAGMTILGVSLSDFISMAMKL